MSRYSISYNNGGGDNYLTNRLWAPPPRIRLLSGFYMFWDNPDQLRIDLASNLPQKKSRIVEYGPKTEPKTLKKMNFNTFVQNSTFIMGLWEIDWGKMSVMNTGSFHVFTKILTLTRVLQVKVHVFPRTSIFVFSV